MDSDDSSRKVTSYWDILPQKTPNWVDVLGSVFLLIGVIYLVLFLNFPSILPNPIFDVAVHDWVVAIPASVAFMLIGALSIARTTQRKFTIPIIKTLLEAYIALGILCTSLGVSAHFRVKKMGAVLALLTVAFIITQAKASDYQDKLRADDATRRVLISYLDRNHLNLSSRLAAIDLYDSINRIGSSSRSKPLKVSFQLLEDLYLLSDPGRDINKQDFQGNLLRASLRVQGIRLIDLRELNNERQELDYLIFLTLASSIEHRLSKDGAILTRAASALRLASEGIKYEELATKQANGGLLPELQSFRNVYGVSLVASAFSGEGRMKTIADRFAMMEEAYASFSSSLQGTSFCRQRALNNQIDLELKSINLPRGVASRLSQRGSLLGKAVSTALAQPDAWLESKLRQLDKVEHYLMLPEVSLTKLQVVSTFAVLRYRQVGDSFCSSSEFRDCSASANDALSRAFALGFDDCQFFKNFDENHIQLLTLCASPGQKTDLCKRIESKFAGESSCMPCRS